MWGLSVARTRTWLELEGTLGTRFEGQKGSNPEELIGAALAGCYSMALANSLATANWFLFLMGAAAFTMLVLRTRREEQYLIERFGEDYRIYMQRTGRFFPRLWRQG